MVARKRGRPRILPQQTRKAGRPKKSEQLKEVRDWNKRKKEGFIRSKLTTPASTTNYTINKYDPGSMGSDDISGGYSYFAEPEPKAFDPYDYAQPTRDLIAPRPPSRQQTAPEPWMEKPIRSPTAATMPERKAATAQVNLIKSSFIDDIRYDVGTMKLTVVISGKEYEYNNITYYTFTQFAAGRAICTTHDPTGRRRWYPTKTPSLGAYYNQYIKMSTAGSMRIAKTLAKHKLTGIFGRGVMNIRAKLKARKNLKK